MKMPISRASASNFINDESLALKVGNSTHIVILRAFQIHSVLIMASNKSLHFSNLPHPVYVH